MARTKNKFIVVGYEAFAIHGEKGLNVEQLSKKVGVNKSSFYHYFVDKSQFFDGLLRHHTQQIKLMGEKERKTSKIDPDLIEIFLEHKIDLLFNKQLRFGAENKHYEAIVQQSCLIIGNDFINIWIKDLQLPFTALQLEGIFNLAMAHLFVQINADNFTRDWLAQYFQDFKKMVQRLG